MFFRTFNLLAVLGLALLVGVAAPVARADDRGSERSLEYPAKAAMVYHTVQFTEWPATAFTNDKSPIIVGLVGNDVFKGLLEQAVKDKAAWGRPLVFRHFPNPDKIEPCHILFVSTSEKDRLGEVFQKVQGKHTLTVSDIDHFVSSGGTMRLMILENKLRFEVRLKLATQAGLKISSKLLKLAVKVYQD